MGKREDSRARIEAQIVEVGRRHLTVDGPAGLSLRAIARELGMVSSAVYRYVASRDDLLTLLLVDAYGELADCVDRARATTRGDWRAGVLEIARAARAWALAHPARWALLYGSPVPGYHAPAERTVIPGTRVVKAIFDTVGDGLVATTPPPATQGVPSDFDRLRDEFGFRGGDELVIRCTALWAGLVGAISLEVFGQYGPDTFSDPTGLFDRQLRLLIEMVAGDN